MAGNGRTPKPKTERRTRAVPIRGEWQPTEGVGWQHGPLPIAPDGLLKPSVEAWGVWLKAWFAAHWTPDDLPSLRQVIRLYDQVERGEYVRAAELRLWLDGMGISKKGQQDRRWAAPKEPDKPVSEPAKGGKYGHLRAVG